MVSEGDIEKYLKKQVEKQNCICLKFTSPGVRGVPDRIVIGKGFIHFVELKAPGKMPRLDQVKQIEKLRKLGARVEVIDSKEKVDNYILSLMAGD